MSSQPSNPRKRPAPGSVPASMPQTYYPTNSPEQVPRWNGNTSGGYMDNSGNNMNYGMISPTQGQFSPGAIATPSSALARRGMNNQLVAANRTYNQPQVDPWTSFGDESLIPVPNGGVVTDEHDNVEVLEEKASRAKRESQAKRKQIPPFVQKLNSFLEESKNTELIRWSEKGDSFIVLDEDEFAKTLIPELFKHNNYASFVRQLNMYGFHKKVGLSDNSMKASERKNKSPSEYYNPYFRRGHPNLLWLINKPKSGNTKKKGKRPEDGEVESDDEIIVDEVVPPSFNQHTVAANRALPAPEGTPLQKKELAVVRNEIQALQESQRQIGEVIKRITQNHAQLTNQAMAFQEMHNRHENSINAILTFLGNVFRKSMEEQGGAHNINDVLASIIPNLQMPQNGHGSIITDLGDYIHPQQQGTATSVTPTPKRPQRLLPPIPSQEQAASRSPSTDMGPPPYNTHQPQMGTVTELFDTQSDSAPTPTYLKQELESNPQEGMMKLIQDANTIARGNGSTGMDLPNLAANTPTQMTADQRNRMLSLMSGNSQTTPSTPTSARPGTVSRSPSNPNIPPIPESQSLSPLMGNAVPPPSLQEISHTQDEIDQLQRLQEEQRTKFDNLNSLLGPYSPSGRIPGLVDGAGNYFDDNVDFGQYLDPTAYQAGDGTGDDFDFTTNFDNANLDASGGDFDGSFNPDMLGANLASSAAAARAGGLETTKTPSDTGTEEIAREDLEASPGGRANKRQRQA